MRRALVGLALVAAACGGPGEYGGFTVRDPSGTITRAPANTARFDAARRELTELTGHPVGLQIDAGLLSNDLASFTEEYARMVENIVAALRFVNRNQPDAFARVGTKLTAVDVRYDATLERAEATLDGTKVLVRTPAGLYRNDIGDAIATAMSSGYHASDGAALFAMDPAQVPADRREAYYDAIVHYSQYDKAKTEATGWDPKRDLVDDDARGRSLQKVIALHAALPAGPLRDKAAEHIASEGEYYVLNAWSDRTREVALAAPPDSVLRATQRAYAAYLGKELARQPEAVQLRSARQLFARGKEAAADQAFAGFDRLGWALGLAKHLYAQKDGTPTALEDEVVCPYRPDAAGKLDRNRSCNAGFYAVAVSTADGRARLGRFLTSVGAAATRTAFANLRWAHGLPVVELFHEVEGHAPTRNAAGRVLGDVLGREGEWRDEVRKEGYALYTRRPEARGLALYMILSTDPHRGLEAANAGLVPKIGPAEIYDLLSVGPRSVQFVADGWRALPFPKASLVAPHLRPAMDTDTLLAVAKAACAEGRPAELNALHTAMENAARASQTDRSRFEGAMEMVRPQACPPPSR